MLNFSNDRQPLQSAFQPYREMAINQSINRISTIVIPRARLLPESFLLGVITIPRAYKLLRVKLLKASTFLEAFLLRNLLLLKAYKFLESTHPSQKKKRLITAR
jgi:hypothetical protein